MPPQRLNGPDAAREVKARGQDLGARLVGIASAGDIAAQAPEGHRPTDLLRGARSVVVLAGAGPTRGTWRAGSSRVAASVGYSRGELAGAARRLANWMEERFDALVLPVPTGNWIGHYPYISLKLCAEAAGLGTRSLAAGIVLNRDYGFLYYNAVATTLDLPPDGPLPEPACPSPSCVRLWEQKGTTPCLSACPDCLSGEIEGGRIRWMEYRQDRCYPRAQTTAMDSFQKLLLQAVNESDPHRRKAILFGSHFGRCVRSLAYSSELSAQCFNCLLRCPLVLGRARRRAPEGGPEE